MKEGVYMITKFIRYDQLKDKMVIKFHGANVIVFNVKHFEREEEMYMFDYRGKVTSNIVVNFDIKPYDDEALEILGNFYAYGNYGGAGFLEVPLVKEKAKTKKLTKKK